MNKILKSLFAALLCLGISQTFAQFIGQRNLTYTDPDRGNRSVGVQIFYPATSNGTNTPVANGVYPIVVFGHGFVMAYSAYQNVWEALVPDGYIVALPTTEGTFSPSHTNFAGDLAFLVNKLKSEGNNPSSPFYQKVGTTSAIMGHSMGGGCSILAAANNANVTTVVNFAAANTNPSAIAEAPNVTVPTLMLSGSRDSVTPTYAHQNPIYDALGSSCKAQVYLQGGGHCYFANSNFNCDFGEGSSGSNPTLTRAEQQRLSMVYTRPWLAYFLKGDCAAGKRFQDSLSAGYRITYRQTQVIGFRPKPVLSPSGMVNFCQGENVTITANPNHNGEWNLNGGSANSITVNQNANVVYTNRDDLGNCPVKSDTTFVSEVQSHIILFSSNNQTICSGVDTIVVEVQPAGGVWNFNGINATDNGIQGAFNQAVLHTASLAPGNYSVFYKLNNCDTDTVFNFTVIAPENLSIYAQNDSICKGANFIAVVNQAVSVNWLINSNSFTGNSISALLDTSAMVYAQITDANNCVINDSVFVTVAEYPSTNIILDEDSVCYGSLVNAFTNAEDNVEYVWQFEANTSIDSSFSFSPSANGWVNLSAITVGFGCTTHDSVYVTVLPKITLQTNAPSSVCNGQPISVCANGAIDYTADCGLFNNNCIDITNYTGNVFTCQIIGSSIGFCSDTAMVSISILTTPDKPVIAQSNDTLYSDVNTGVVNWFNNSGQLVGTGYYFVPPSDGFYFATYTNNQGCESEPSDTVYFANTGIQVIGNSISIFPNPTQAILNTTEKSGAYTIVDVCGRVVLSGKLDNGKIYVNELQKGLYFLNLSCNKGVVIKEFIKE